MKILGFAPAFPTPCISSWNFEVLGEGSGALARGSGGRRRGQPVAACSEAAVGSGMSTGPGLGVRPLSSPRLHHAALLHGNGVSPLLRSATANSCRSLASVGMGSTDGTKVLIRRVPTSPAELLNLAPLWVPSTSFTCALIKCLIRGISIQIWIAELSSYLHPSNLREITSS